MKIYVDKNADEMGKRAAEITAELIRKAIADHGECRILLSTGASQFEVLSYLTKYDLPWDKVTGFHLELIVYVWGNFHALNLMTLASTYNFRGLNGCQVAILTDSGIPIVDRL